MQTKKRKSLFVIGSVVIGITALLIVYFILIASGAIQTRQNKLVFTAGSAQKAYDGTALVCEEWELTAGVLSDGYRVEAKVSGSQTLPGTANNEMTVTIYDSENADVTDNYVIECLPGTLTVDPLGLTIRSESKQKVYDGKPLTGEKYEIYGEIAPGHRVEASVSGEITEVGSVENTVNARVYDENGADVTNYYSLVGDFGTLTVSPIKLTLSTNNADKLYDGTPLTSDGWKWIAGEDDMLDGHRLDVTVTGTITNAGTVENSVIARVYDSRGKDVTNCYAFDSAYLGKLTVHRSPITVYSGSADKLFDGSPLFCYDYGLENGALTKGDSIRIYSNTSLTYPGSIPNIIRVQINDSHGNDVTGNYQITYNTGTLSVYDPGVTVAPGGVVDESPGEGGDSGSSKLDHSGDIMTGAQKQDGEKIVLLKIYTGYAGTVYLRDFSYGDYNGAKWGKAQPYAESAALIPNYLTSAALAAGGNPHSLSVDVVQKDLPYLTPYYTTTYLSEGDDLHTGKDSLKMMSSYGCNFIPYDYVSGKTAGAHTTHKALEAKYAQFVRNNYLSVPASTKASLLALAAENGLSGSSDTLVADVQKYIRGAAKYAEEFSYPGNISDVAIYFLTEAKQGICQHFATAATLMYRALGLPARYVTGLAPTARAGEETEVTAIDAHAWVEVYIGGLGWVHVEVTPGGARGAGGGGDYVIGGDVSTEGKDPGAAADEVFLRVYKSIETPLYLRDRSFGAYNGKGWDDAVGYRGEYNSLAFTGIAAGGNRGYANITMRKKGLPYLTPYYDPNVSLASGDSDVHTGPTSLDESRYYYHYFVDYDYFTAGAVSVPDNLRAAESAYYEYVGENYLAVPDATKTALLDIAAKNGLRAGGKSLIADVRDYIVSAAVYDTEYFFPAGVEDVAVSFLTEVKRGVCQHFATAAVLMYRSLGIPARYTAGFLVNGDAYKDIDVRGRDAHAWAEVYIAGTGWIKVEVTAPGYPAGRKFVSVKPADAEKEYDGYTLKAPQHLSETSANLFGEGTYYNVEIEGSLMNVGHGYSTIKSLRVFDADGNDITDDYNITYETGSLFVYYAELRVKSSSATKEYDGTPLSGEGSEWELTAGELMPGHTFGDVTFDSSVTYVNTSYPQQNHFVVPIYANGSEIGYFYKINYDYGTLTVTPRKLIITTGSAEKEYDGTPLYNYDWEVSDETPLVAGDEIKNMYCISSQTAAGSRKNEASYVLIMDANGFDKTGNYDIEYVYGTLTVTPRKITITTESATKQYDGDPLTADGYEVTEGSLVAGETLYGVYCNGSQTEEGKSENTLKEQSPYIRDRYGNDMTANYEITYVYGTLEVTEPAAPIEITVKPTDVWKIYDGKQLNAGSSYDIVKGKLAGGDYLAIACAGAQTEIGTGESRIVSCTAYDKNGNVLRDKYNITLRTGRLSVYRAEIRAESSAESKVYDGKPVTIHAPYHWVSAGALADGHKIVCTPTGSRTDVGTSQNTFKVVVRDAHGNDVTNQYRIVSSFGTLKVTAAKVTVTAGSAEKAYDGSELTCAEYAVEGLPDGFTLSAVTEGAVVRGVGVNRIKKVVITDASGTDVTRNFDIERVNGTLKAL